MESSFNRTNPPNPFTRQWVEWLDTIEDTKVEVFEERAKSIISSNNSPDIPFTYSINPYRGCFHACAYCYARPTHQYIDFGAGRDFERKIVAKVNAPILLREEFMKKGWKGDTLVFSGVTDCYQPLELSYELTRRCLLVCAEFRNPVSIITKGAIVRRDINILAKLASDASVRVHFSIASADDELSQAIEPGAPRPTTRFRAMKELHEAGIPVGVSVSPLIPGLNEHMIPEILERARECGASSAFMTLLRLPTEVLNVFQERVQAALPSKFGKVISRIEKMRGGAKNSSEFHKRMEGEGEEWKIAQLLFERTCEQLGITDAEGLTPIEKKEEKRPTFRRPTPQMSFPGME